MNGFVHGEQQHGKQKQAEHRRGEVWALVVGASAFFFFFFFFLLALSTLRREIYSPQPKVDIQKEAIPLEMTQEGSSIRLNATITIKLPHEDQHSYVIDRIATTWTKAMRLVPTDGHYCWGGGRRNNVFHRGGAWERVPSRYRQPFSELTTEGLTSCDRGREWSNTSNYFGATTFCIFQSEFICD